MFCPGRRVSRLTAIRGKSPRRSRSRRYPRSRKRTRARSEREKEHACVRASEKERGRYGKDAHICALPRAVFSNSPWLMAIGGFLSHPARRQVITWSVGRLWLQVSYLARTCGYVALARTRARRCERVRARSLKRERRAGRYSIMATDCVKHPPRRVCRASEGESRDWVVDVETRNGQTEKKE